MIVEIEKSTPSCRSALDYNEKKVLGGVAELIAYANLPGCRHEDIYDTFEEYQRAKYPIRNMSFHASVNPSETDSCSEEQITDFIVGLMNELGLGNQPYLIYRHDDIERSHYHIVSVRADRNGRKINDLYEKKRATAYMNRTAIKYGFTLPQKKERVRTASSLTDEIQPSARFRRFRPGQNVAEQFKEIFAYALSFDFDGPQQLCCVLETLGVHAELRTADDSPYFVFRGLDDKGREVTDVMSERMLGVPMYGQCLTASIANKQGHHLRAREKERLRGLVGAAFNYSKSETHFENILRNKGVGVHLSRDVNGEVFGITFVDQRTKSVFKASEIRDVISVAMMRQAVDSGRWRVEDRGGTRNRYVRQSRSEAHREALALRDSKAGIIARIIQPVGQPQGNSWSGKSKDTDEQKKDDAELKRIGGLSASLKDDRFETSLE